MEKPPSLNGPEGTFFDKPPPTGPPTPPTRSIPIHLAKIVQFFQGIIADEGLLLDLCLDRAMGIVEFNYKKRLVGSDFFNENPPGPFHFAGVAAPLAVELYKAVLVSVNDRGAEYTKLLEEAQETSSNERTPHPVIFVP